MFKTINTVSKAIQDNRTSYNILTYLMEEVGELATEINIATGYAKKLAGKDGVIGEAVDAIICLVDIITQYDQSITEEEILELVNKKLQKWVDNRMEFIQL